MKGTKPIINQSSKRSCFMKYQTPFVQRATVVEKNGRLVATEIIPTKPSNFAPNTPRFYASELAREYGVYSDQDTIVKYRGGKDLKLNKDEWNFTGFIMHDQRSSK